MKLKAALPVLFLLLTSLFSFSQNIIRGVVRDSRSGEPLFGANVVIQGTTLGTVTDLDGKFHITTDAAYPVELMVSYIGYLSLRVTVKNKEAVTVKLKSNEVMLKDVEVVGSRISEKQKEAPLTIEAMDMIAIKETPAANFYEGLGQLKGVDLTSASLGFKVINTRGFNSTSPVRSLQLIDGVDNQSPGLNFSLGNFLGACDLDVQKVDLVVGASSAYHGPNAFNGVISMTTRSPFIKPGLEVSYKIGERNLSEICFRWAEFFRNKKDEPKFGYKFNWFMMQADDWPAENMAATPQSRNDETNIGGYDAVNRYGDEYSSAGDFSLSPRTAPGLGTYYRRGYKETDLVDYNTKNMKIGGAFHYRLRPGTEVILSSNFGTGTTVYQGDNRYSLKDILFFQNRIEVKKENKFFIRAYATHEDAGKSYDAFATALLLQRSSKSDINWYRDYYNFYVVNYKNKILNFPGFPKPPLYNPLDTNGYSAAYQAYLASINPFLLNNYADSLVKYHLNSTDYANGPGAIQYGEKAFYEPGTIQFDTAFARIISTKSTKGGSLFFDRSALYHAQGEYQFTFHGINFTAGASYRIFRPNSQGTIFSDTSYVRYNTSDATGDTLSTDTLYRKITNRETGVYAGAERKFLNDKLKAGITCRMDKNENFDYLFSPAASLVYLFNPDNLIRLSFSSAIRNPTLTDQYLYYNVGRALLIGNITGFDSLVTIPSLLNALAYQYPDTLDYFNVKPVRPEEVKTFEAGFRLTLFNRLYMDASAYYSRYKYFIGYKVGAAVSILTITNSINVKQVYRVATNSEDRVDTYGLSAGLNYYIGKHFALAGNYSYNKLDRRGSTDPLIPAYNTPLHKFNIGFNGRDWNNFGFNINYKWVDGFLFEGSPQFTGNIRTYNMVDVQVNRRVPSIYTTFKLGANNLLNNLHYEVYGGPQVGRLIYFSVLVELHDGN